MTEHVQHLLISFLRKFFFILKAASDGWCVRYIGGNKFQFRYSHYDILKKLKFTPSTEQFINTYVYKKMI